MCTSFIHTQTIRSCALSTPPPGYSQLKHSVPWGRSGPASTIARFGVPSFPGRGPERGFSIVVPLKRALRVITGSVASDPSGDALLTTCRQTWLAPLKRRPSLPEDAVIRLGSEAHNHRTHLTSLAALAVAHAASPLEQAHDGIDNEPRVIHAQARFHRRRTTCVRVDWGRRASSYARATLHSH